MREFWFLYGLGLIIYLYMIFVIGNYNLISNLSLYSLFGVFAYSIEKSFINNRRKKIESFS